MVGVRKCLGFGKLEEYGNAEERWEGDHIFLLFLSLTLVCSLSCRMLGQFRGGLGKQLVVVKPNVHFRDYCRIDHTKPPILSDVDDHLVKNV